MDFLGMIAVGILGLTFFWRVFLLAFKGIGKGFSTVEKKIFNDDDD